MSFAEAVKTNAREILSKPCGKYLEGDEQTPVLKLSYFDPAYPMPKGLHMGNSAAKTTIADIVNAALKELGLEEFSVRPKFGDEACVITLAGPEQIQAFADKGINFPEMKDLGIKVPFAVREA